MSKRTIAKCVAAALLLLYLGASQAGAAQSCRKVVLDGEATAGQEWKSTIGEGWVFRLVPIVAGKSGYTGWDLVVDRLPGAGFPDALYLATPPYNSINEHEVGTTFGLRAQDAIGWNPRSFHFLTNSSEFREAQSVYSCLIGGCKDSRGSDDVQRVSNRLLELQKHASFGELRILDARITPGVADPAPFAQGWAMAAARMQHQTEPPRSGQSTAYGYLNWMRFSIALWLPAGWVLPPGLHATPAACIQ